MELRVYSLIFNAKLGNTFDFEKNFFSENIFFASRVCLVNAICIYYNRKHMIMRNILDQGFHDPSKFVDWLSYLL